MAGDRMNIGDRRETIEETNGTYTAFCILVYGFLALIALITVFNIINSISMSVTARSKQYGFMRAIGMDNRQVRSMIRSEAFTYAVLGCIAGCVIGLPLNGIFYTTLISHYWGDSWKVPFDSLAVILCIVLGAALIASDRPSKKILESTVVDTINYY